METTTEDPRFRYTDQRSLADALKRLQTFKADMRRHFSDAELFEAKRFGELINEGLDHHIDRRAEEAPTPDDREALRRRANGYGYALVLIARERPLRPSHVAAVTGELGEILAGITIEEICERQAKEDETERTRSAEGNDPWTSMHQMFGAARAIKPISAEEQAACDAFHQRIASYLPEMMTLGGYSSPGRDALERLKTLCREASGIALVPGGDTDDIVAETFAKIAVERVFGTPETEVAP